jgi:hypothetical protein
MQEPRIDKPATQLDALSNRTGHRRSRSGPMTTKAIATATVDEIVENPKRTTKSTSKSAKGVVKKAAPKKS